MRISSILYIVLGFLVALPSSAQIVMEYDSSFRLDESKNESQDHFGTCMAGADDLLFVSKFNQPSQGDVGIGSFYQYQKDGITDEWSLVKEHRPATFLDYEEFASSLTYRNQTLFVGAVRYLTFPIQSVNDRKGRVYVYKLNQQKVLTLDQTLLYPGAEVVPTGFGSKVCASDSFLAVGVGDASYNALGQDSQSAAGLVFIYKQKAGKWSLHQTIVDPNRRAGNQFGSNVAMGDSFLFVKIKNRKYTIPRFQTRQYRKVFLLESN